MVRGLDMTLDEILLESRRNRGRSRNFRGRGGGRGFGPGPDHRRLNREVIRASPYPMMPQQMQVHTWQQQFAPMMDQSNPLLSTKLYISNLDYGVSNEDIRVLFSDVGNLKSHSIHYDGNGRPKGTAEVIFYHQADALAAIRRYNDVCLDGKPMRIEIVGANSVTPAHLPPANLTLPRPNGSGQERANTRGQGRGWFQRGSVISPGKMINEGKTMTAKELDTDLDKYRSEASKTRQS